MEKHLVFLIIAHLRAEVNTFAYEQTHNRLVMNTRTRKKEAPANGNNPTLLSANQKYWVAMAIG